jgi:hypothetical protein
MRQVNAMLEDLLLSRLTSLLQRTSRRASQRQSIANSVKSFDERTCFFVIRDFYN